MDLNRLEKQMRFIMEIDKLKRVYRKTKNLDGKTYENDAEHSWHLAMMVLVLGEHANESHLDLLKVLKLVLIHDLVEIDAGDTYAYDDQARATKKEREQAAAGRLFSILPEDQGSELQALWLEYEQQESPESRFASSLDKLQPLLFNYTNGGELWRANHITSDQVTNRNQRIATGSELLWEYAQTLIADSVQQGLLKS